VKVYRVGGSVRDELLGRPIVDRDYVVVGAAPQEMLERGFKPVGREFPVFLHPETHEEYALARTERKRGRGHRGFSFHAAPEVTLEEDLARRDLTINAMARDADGTLIDPYDGASDLRRGVLRHVGPAFVEDPLRVLRVARFAARFGFTVAAETEALLREIAASGELATLTRERVWQELAKALLEAYPSRFFVVLSRCGALAQLLPEVDPIFETPVRLARRTAEALPAVLRGLDSAASAGSPLAVRYAVLVSDLAPPGATQGANTARNLRLADAVNGRLGAPADCAAVALATARERPLVERARELSASGLLGLLLSLDALRRPSRLEHVLAACAAGWAARTGRTGAEYPSTEHLRRALDVVRKVNAAPLVANTRRTDLPKRVRALRLRALREWLERLPAR
jgi:tRNA nucleotidyltransferase (CCA-adding enzyme)